MLSSTSKQAGFLLCKSCLSSRKYWKYYPLFLKGLEIFLPTAKKLKPSRQRFLLRESRCFVDLGCWKAENRSVLMESNIYKNRESCLLKSSTDLTLNARRDLNQALCFCYTHDGDICISFFEKTESNSSVKAGQELEVLI